MYNTVYINMDVADWLIFMHCIPVAIASFNAAHCDKRWVFNVCATKYPNEELMHSFN